MIEQNVKSLGIRFQARIQLDLFEELFRRRITSGDIKIPKAMELAFLEPTSAAEERIRQAIFDYRAYQGKAWQAELRRQSERLAAAERSLVLRSTKKALSEQRIASNKIAFYESKLADLGRERLEPSDRRIYPQWYAPVVYVEQGEYLVAPMRYHLRPSGKPAEYDQRFDGLYNARRDSLTGFWRNQFGRRHAIVVVSSFYENVARHDYEHRALAPGERAQNLVVEFRPTEAGEPQADMTVACVWDHWTHSGAPELRSFAAITDEPPDEVRETGHDRCVVALRSNHVALWLTPQERRDEELFRLLGDREPFRYEHRLAG